MIFCTRLNTFARVSHLRHICRHSIGVGSSQACNKDKTNIRRARFLHFVKAKLGEEKREKTWPSEEPHIPVLLDEVLRQFADVQIQTFVDGTLGAGGHSAAILGAHPEIDHFWGLDVDPRAHVIARERLQHTAQEKAWGCQMDFVQTNYSQIKTAISTGESAGTVDGILLDLGTSSMQMDSAERGFSFMRDGPLDMRMGLSSGASAEQILNSWPEPELARIFREYGEERHWRAYAARVVDAREKGPIRTTQQLCAALGYIGKRGGKRSKIHPATRVFQAVRIAVNDELGHLEKAIPECIDCLKPQGRLAVITFHSLEDRIVKRAFLKAAGKEEDHSLLLPQPLPILGKILTRKPIAPSEAEETKNPRSRSGKLRVFERA